MERYTLISDTSLATAAITSPWWHQVDNMLTWYMLAAGAVLVTLRVLITYRAWRKGKADVE